MSSSETATVLALLPRSQFRLRAADGECLGGLSREAKRNGVTLLVGQSVVIRRAPLDPARVTILGLVGHGSASETT